MALWISVLFSIGWLRVALGWLWMAYLVLLNGLWLLLWIVGSYWLVLACWLFGFSGGPILLPKSNK